MYVIYVVQKTLQSCNGFHFLAKTKEMDLFSVKKNSKGEIVCKHILSFAGLKKTLINFMLLDNWLVGSSIYQCPNFKATSFLFTEGVMG